MNEIRKPQFCVISLTTNCMFQCKTCFTWQIKKAQELTVKEWKSFIEGFSKLVNTTQETHVHFTGGEPLLKEGLIDLIKYTSDKGFRTSMATNAYLIDKEKAKEIVNSGLNTISISLNSLKEETHDYIKGVNGSHRRVMESIGYLNEFRKDNFQICVTPIINAFNIEDITDLTQWVINNSSIDKISFQAITSPFTLQFDDQWYKKKEFCSLWPEDQDKVSGVIDKLIAFKANKTDNEHDKITNPVSQLKVYKLYFKNPKEFVKSRRCNLTDYSLNITPSGNACLCFEMSPIGNVGQADIGRLWYSVKAEEIRARIKDCKHNCELVINNSYEE